MNRIEMQMPGCRRFPSKTLVIRAIPALLLLWSASAIPASAAGPSAAAGGPASAAKAAACKVDRAEKLVLQGRYEAALEALKPCPSEPRTKRAKGMAFHGLFQPDSAIANLKGAFESGLKDDGVLLPLSESFLWKKDFRNAAMIMEGIKDKQSANYFKVVARKHEILGELPLAVEFYDKAIALEKLPYGTMERKAIVLSWMKKFDESLALFDSIIKVKIVSKPLKVRCLVREGEVLSWKGEFDPAIAKLQKALALDKGNLDARFVKGRILEWKGEYKPAKAVYQEILGLSPGHEQAKLKLEKLSWVE